ncbi:MAG: cytochrome b/b6 domain-containing protein [Nitrospirota bacterium]|nr:MAG: cytochrome b/b6 domain-containing protein [Nitrospirota bacterium]
MNQENTVPKNIPEEVERFNIIFRIQHIIMFTTFLLLSFTGWGLKYAEVDVSSWWIRIWGGAEVAGLIHRIAGIGMLIDFAWHVLYLIYLFSTGKLKVRARTTLIPIWKDVEDVVQNFAYFLGLTRNKPRFCKFNYAQKFDYWAVFWGMFIIGSSGFALAFPILISYIVPEFTTGWIWQAISIMHSDEALLAIVFILFWHFYNEHLKPEVFPMSWVWITGKISTEELKHKHPLEYEILFPEDKPGKEGASDAK